MICVKFLLFFLPFVFCGPVNICRKNFGSKIYVDMGETGTLSAENITAAPLGHLQSKSGPGPPTPRGNLSHQQCAIELVTCPSCVITLTFTHLNLTHHCGPSNLLMDSPCRCDYVWISEPPYDDVPGRQLCGISQNNTEDPNLTYYSKTRTVNIALLFSQSHQHAFSITYSSKRNREVITGNPDIVSNSTGSIASPFFPYRYPRDLAAEYLFACADPVDCRVMLTFSDFQIGGSSFIEFFDGQNRRIDVASGLSFRPPIIISSGPSLIIRFYANGGAGPGFKAVYSFITASYAETAVKPSTDCGGVVEDFGGAITMMNMVLAGTKSYDCVWLIRPPENFFNVKSHLFLKVSNFLDFASNTELEVRQGLTSDQPLIETLRYPATQFHPFRTKEHVVPVNTGFYVRFKGSFNTGSKMAVTYAAFSYNKCFPGSEFLCSNHRCISGKLSCDTFDHCGDNSDEPASCFQEWDPVFGDRHPYSQNANYFFPKTDRYADLKTATVVFLVSSLGLIVLITALIVLLYRINSRARQQRELQTHLQTISEMLADNARMEELAHDEPPDYEAPPEYNDMMKAPPSSNRRRRHVSRRSSRRSRSSPGDRRRGSHGSVVPILEVNLPEERPQERSSHLHTPYRGNRRPSAVSVSSAIPESPPPAYSPTNSERFVYVATSTSVPDVTIDIEGENSPWWVTAVSPSTQQPVETPAQFSPPREVTPLLATSSTNPQLEARTPPSRNSHRRTQSCGDICAATPPRTTHQSQSNPLTPYQTPTFERTAPPPTPIVSPSPTTDSDFCVFSSLESADIDGSYIRSKDFFDWEEFDKQFPRRKDDESISRRCKVAQILKKYDHLVFRGENVPCECQGACSCPNYSSVWGNP